MGPGRIIRRYFGVISFIISFVADLTYEFRAIGVMSVAISVFEFFCYVGIPGSVKLAVKRFPALNPYLMMRWIVRKDARARIIVRWLRLAIVPLPHDSVILSLRKN